MLYNDHSPMEQHHLSAAFGVLYSSSSSRGSVSQGSMDFISGFSHKTRSSFRKHVIDMVLATDMKQHFNQLSLFLTKLPPLVTGPSSSPANSPLTSNPINVQSQGPNTGRLINRNSMIGKWPILLSCPAF
jgi:cAMP-specific phosphodiesterase 4